MWINKWRLSRRRCVCEKDWRCEHFYSGGLIKGRFGAQLIWNHVRFWCQIMKVAFYIDLCIPLNSKLVTSFLICDGNIIWSYTWMLLIYPLSIWDIYIEEIFAWGCHRKALIWVECFGPTSQVMSRAFFFSFSLTMSDEARSRRLSKGCSTVNLVAIILLVVNKWKSMNVTKAGLERTGIRIAWDLLYKVQIFVLMKKKGSLDVLYSRSSQASITQCLLDFFFFLFSPSE